MPLAVDAATRQLGEGVRREWGIAQNEVRVRGFSRELGMAWPDYRKSLAWAYRELRFTGRGKHIGGYSYYHALLAAERKDVLRYLIDLKTPDLEPALRVQRGEAGSPIPSELSSLWRFWRPVSRPYPCLVL